MGLGREIEQYLSVKENKKSAASAFSLRAYKEKTKQKIITDCRLKYSCNKHLSILNANVPL